MTPQTLASACRQMAPVLQGIDAETTDDVQKLCDPATVITLADADALGVALLLELRKARTRATRR